MSELTSNELFNQLMIPQGMRLDVNTVRKYMLDDGLQEVNPAQMKKSIPSKVKKAKKAAS